MSKISWTDETTIIKTPITADPYSLFAGICSLCGKWIHWAEPYLEGEVGLDDQHIDCDKAYLDF